jgi:hypothetical protein
MSPKRTTRRKAIAAAQASGEPLTKTARKLKVSREYASREANAQGTRLVLADLLRPHAAQLEKLVARSIEVLEDGLKAGHTHVLANGDLVHLPIDHRTRLTAVRQLADLISRGRAAEEDLGDHVLTYTVVQQAYQVLCQIKQTR